MSELTRTMPPPGERYDNVTSSDHCRFCCDDGWVLAGTETWLGAPLDVAAPCPACLRGYRAEFPTHSRWRWGSAGYWRGRPWGLQERCPHLPRRGTPADPGPAVAEAREAFRALLGKGPEPTGPVPEEEMIDL